MSYVTGIGVISAIGLNTKENLESLIRKKSGMSSLCNFKSAHNVPVGEIKLSNEELKCIAMLPKGRIYSRTALLGLIAAREALADAGIDPHKYEYRIGIVSANSAGGMDLSEIFFKQHKEGKHAPLRNVINHDCGSSTEVIASTLGIKGFMTTISTACSSSANSIMLADRLLKSGRLDVVVAGGIDPLCLFTINGFSSLMILDNELSRPFDKSRAGLNLGEGAGFVVLENETEESKRKAYCRLAGYANANDAHHQTATSPEGDGPLLAMKGAIEMAGIKPTDIDYINAHGTGTANNDLSEGKAMRRLFGENVPRFSSTKVYTGHTLGAAGGIEAVFTAISLKNKILFPTFNFSTAIDELDLTPITEVVNDENIKYELSNSFGFGGNVSSLLFERI